MVAGDDICTLEFAAYCKWKTNKWNLLDALQSWHVCYQIWSQENVQRKEGNGCDASIDDIFSFLYIFLTIYEPLTILMILELLTFFYFMLRIFVFRIKLFQEDIVSTNGLETHQNGSSTGNGETCQNESLAHGMKNHQDFSVFGDMYWKLPLKCFRW